MNITIYSGFSKEHNSTKQPTGGTSVTCVLKENTSLINPVFILEGANFSTNYVTWNNRHYFVDDVVSIRNGCVELHCSVDALASWKTQIGGSTQYVTRSASSYNDRLIDNKYPTYAGADVDITALSGDFANTINPSNGCFVVGVIGNNGAGSGVAYYAFDGSLAPFSSFIDELFQGNFLDAPTTEISLELQKELVNPFQYILSCTWYPFAIGGSNTPVKFGYWTLSANGLLIAESSRVKAFTSGKMNLPRHPQTTSYGRYVNSNPFTEHLLTVYSFGDLPIPSEYFVDSSDIYVNMYVDVFNGAGQLTVANSDQYVFSRSFGQIGVNIPISQIHTNPIVTSLGILSNKANDALQGFKDQWVMGAASQVLSALSAKSAKVVSMGSMGSKAAFEYPARVVTTFAEVCNTDPQHNGRPLMKRVTISSLSGFIQVENPDVDIPATSQEKDVIANYMQSGFYYE